MAAPRPAPAPEITTTAALRGVWVMGCSFYRDPRFDDDRPRACRTTSPRGSTRAETEPLEYPPPFRGVRVVAGIAHGFFLFRSRPTSRRIRRPGRMAGAGRARPGPGAVGLRPSRRRPGAGRRRGRLLGPPPAR